MTARSAERHLVCFLCVVASASVARADTVTIGSQAGAQIFFTGTLSRYYNFGITQTGAQSGLVIDALDVNVKGSNSPSAPVLITLYDGLGGTGSVLTTGTILASSLTTQFQFINVPIPTLTLATGGYSVVLTTTASENYYIKNGATKLTTNGSTSVISSYWVEDANTNGTAGTTLVATGTVLATWTLGTNAMAFGNYRVGATLSSTTPLVNTALVTSNTVTQALAATGATAGGVNSLTGLPSPYLSVGGTSQIVAGLNGATTGPNSGTATLTFNSVPGTSATTGTTAVGSGTLALSGTGWNWANAKVSSGTFSFGNVRTGVSVSNQTVAIGNQAVSLAAYQDLLDVSGSASNGQVSVTGFQNLASSTNGTTTNNVTLAANTTVAGSLASTVSLTYASDANGVAGLSNGSATIVGGTAPTLATTGGVYDYANATYSGTAFAFGYLHRGAAAVSGTVGIGNQTVTNSSYQDTLNVSGSTGNGLVSATGFNGLTASSGGATRNNLVVAAATGTAGSLDSTVALSLVSNANGVAGLSNGTATVVGTPGSITTSGTVYTGQSTWTTNGSGQWGTLASNFGTNWDWATFDGSPGVDPGFTNTDTATFGNAVTSGTATVTITSATASVRGLTFSNSAASYALAGSSGGALVIRGGVTNATIDVTAGAHAIAAPVEFASTAALDVATGSRLLFSGGASGTGGFIKTGGGVVEIVNTNGYSGNTLVDGGTLTVNGVLTTSDVQIGANATLMGSGTLGGDVLVAGTHSPGNSPDIQTVSGSLTYQAGSDVIWELIDNTLAGRGTNYDGIDVGGALTFSGSTSLDLVFNLNGSSVDWSNAFWATEKTGTNGWLVYDGASSLSGFANLQVATLNWTDGQGDSLQSVRPGAGFSTYQDGNDIYLTYAIQAVPEPSTWALLAAGAVVFGLREARRRRNRDSVAG